MGSSVRTGPNQEIAESPIAVLTTGQVAKLCGVSSDTVLKWIKKGRLKATRTVGGHCRIDRSDLVKLLQPSGDRPDPAVPRSAAVSHLKRCWEFLADGDCVPAECRACLVYQIRAAWCFKVGTPGCEVGSGKHLCQIPCDQCRYYKRATGGKAKVLVISHDAETISGLVGVSSDLVEIGFARNGYEASAVLCDFRPTFVLVDEGLLLTTESGLMDYLAHDPRVRGMKLVLVGRHARSNRPQGGLGIPGVAGIAKPIELTAVEDLARDYEVELIPPDETAGISERFSGGR